MKQLVRLAGLLLSLLVLLNGCGGGDSSSGSSGGAPAVPSNVTATPNGSTGIIVAWAAVSDATGYNIYRSTTADQPLALMTKATPSTIAYGSAPYYDLGLTAATTYHYKVTAVTSGVENASTEASATTVAASALTQMGGSMQGNALTLTGAVSGVASGFSTPSDVTTDGASVYLTDQGTRSVLKIAPATGAATILLGTGGCTASLCSPRGLTTDGVNLYIVDMAGSIQKIVLATGAASTFVTGLNLPDAITTDGVHLYVTDASGIKKINITTAAVTLLTATTGHALTTDGNSLYLLNNNSVQKVDMVTGAITLFAGSQNTLGQADGVGGAATFFTPNNIMSDGTSLYVTQNNSLSPLPLRKIDIATVTVSTIASPTSGLGITTDGTNLYYVTENVLSKMQ